MAHICTVQMPPFKQAVRKLDGRAVVNLAEPTSDDLSRMTAAYNLAHDQAMANGQRAQELEAKVAYWEKHHTECHDKWRREFQLRDAPVYVKLDALQAEADNLAEALESCRAFLRGRSSKGDVEADQALAAYAKFKAGGA